MSKYQIVHKGLDIITLGIAGVSALYGHIGVGVAGICLYLLANLKLQGN